MKKRARFKKSKTKSQAPAKHEVLDLVTVMAKLVERFGALETKVDLVISRLPSQNSAVKSPFGSERTEQNQRPAPRERTLYDAVCADCQKNCRVPFRPKEGRPVYCPECFAIRKAGHAPKDLIGNIKIPQFPKPVLQPPPSKRKRTAAPKKKTPKSSKRSKK